MLQRLVIKNFALIKSAELQLANGLTVFTGETGAGKSMLIDALSLAVGARGGVGFIQEGAKSATIEATFELPSKHPSLNLADDMGLDTEDNTLIMRRQVNADGKTRCFVNGLNITQGQMSELGELLVDIHGQRDQQLLLKSQYHATLLDGFSGKPQTLTAVTNAHTKWHDLHNQLTSLQDKATSREKEIDLLQAYVTELDTLAPKAGEEEELSAERQRLMQGEKIQTALDDARVIIDSTSASTQFGKAERMLHAYTDTFPEVAELVNQLAEAATLAADAESSIDALASSLEADPEQLAHTDERLHQLRSLARKHNCLCDDLPEKHQELQNTLETLQNLDVNMAELEAKTAAAWADFAQACDALTKQREVTAGKLAKAVEDVLSTLKMPDMRFEARLEPLPESGWNANGKERVAFYVRTNPGTPYAPLEKAASGGEVSRLMLALKVVFFANMPSQTLVFDEIDTGVGGAVADAMGLCLSKLGGQHQVFAITHLPQVAAKGQAHMQIQKQAEENSTQTQVVPLVADARRDEIARMLSGADLTDAAKEAANSLLATG